MNKINEMRKIFVEELKNNNVNSFYYYKCYLLAHPNISQKIFWFDAVNVNEIFNTPNKCLDYIFSLGITSYDDYDFVIYNNGEIQFTNENHIPLYNIFNWLIQGDYNKNVLICMVLDDLESTSFTDKYYQYLAKVLNIDKNSESLFDMWFSFEPFSFLFSANINDIIKSYQCFVKNYQ